MTAQLILPIGVDDTPGLDNFIAGPNEQLLSMLKQRLELRATGREGAYVGAFIWGGSGTGKSHLLKALAQWIKENGGKTVWLAPGHSWMPRSGDGLNRVYLLDDIEGFVADSAAEKGFLTLIERIKQQKSMLLMMAGQPVKQLSVSLADLSSRLQAMESFELQALGERHKKEVLRQRARQRGILLGNDVINWLFTHTSRELGVLLNLLDRVDVQSLSQKRKVTIPLIKSILESS